MSSALHDLHMAVAASNKAYFGFVETGSGGVRNMVKAAKL